MQLRNIYIVAAREAVSDSADGTNSIIKVIENFDININTAEMDKQGVEMGKKAIIVPVNYSIATSWYINELLKKETNFTFKLYIVDSAGNRHEGPIQSHVVPKGVDRINVGFSVEGLPVMGAGRYECVVEVLSNDKLLAQNSYPFTVTIKEN